MRAATAAPSPSRWRRFLWRVRRLLRPPRRFPPTREGWWFIVGTLLVGAAAVNSGFNLLFLVWGMMIFLILASGILSELCLRKLRVVRTPPEAVHAGQPFLMALTAANGKRRLPSFSIEVEDLVGDKPVERRCYFLKIPAGRTQQASYRSTAGRRGVYRLTGFRIATKFPFGLIRKSLDVEAPAEILVYPALRPVPPDLTGGAPERDGQRQQPQPARRGDFHALREFRPGDDPRDIHWRTSARRGRPFVRESEDDAGRTALVQLDDALAPSPEAFEAAVSMAASVALHLLARGFRVALGTRGALVSWGEGPVQAARILRHLTFVGGAAADVPLGDAPQATLRAVVRAGREAPSVDVSRPVSVARAG